MRKRSPAIHASSEAEYNNLLDNYEKSFHSQEFQTPFQKAVQYQEFYLESNQAYTMDFKDNGFLLNQEANETTQLEDQVNFQKKFEILIAGYGKNDIRKILTKEIQPIRSENTLDYLTFQLDCEDFKEKEFLSIWINNLKNKEHREIKEESVKTLPSFITLRTPKILTNQSKKSKERTLKLISFCSIIKKNKNKASINLLAKMGSEKSFKFLAQSIKICLEFTKCLKKEQFSISLTKQSRNQPPN